MSYTDSFYYDTVRTFIVSVSDVNGFATEKTLIWVH